MSNEVNDNLTMAEYRAVPAVNASAIVAGRLSMKHMRLEMTRKSQPETPAMRFGRLVHSAILEPDLFFSVVSVFDGMKRGKDWEAFKADNDPDWIVSTDEQRRLMAISASVHGNRHAHALIDGSQHEVSVFWMDVELGYCKARLDGLTARREIYDIKSTGNIEKHAFSRTGTNLGYHVKMAWYRRAIQANTGNVPAVYLIAVEQDEPFDCVVRDMPEPVLAKGEKEAIEIVKRYRVAESLGRYPGVSDEIEPFELAPWAGGAEKVELQIGGETVEV